MPGSRAAPAASPGPVALADAARARLSARELDILTRIAQGHTAAEVAHWLAVSPHTVDTGIRNIHGKLEVRSRLHAIDRGRAIDQMP